MTAGCFGLVLHAHIPYVRKAGVWPFGEEWLFEVMADTYKIGRASCRERV